MLVFSKLKNQVPVVEAITTSNIVHEEFNDRESFNSILLENGDISDISLECCRAVYFGLKDNNMKLVSEGFSDMMTSVTNFFKKLWEAFKSFVKKIFVLLESYFTDFEKFAEKYKDNSDNIKPFSVNMFNYTIDTGNVDRIGLDGLVSTYNATIGKIKGMKMGDLQEMITKEGGTDFFNRLRGKMVKSSEVKKDKFEDALFKFYRDNKTTESSVEINSAKIRELISRYPELKEAYKKTKSEASDVDSMFNDLIGFFKEMPTYSYKDSDTKKIPSHKISTSGNDGITIDKDGEEDYDNDYFKKMTAYYNFRLKQAKEVSHIYTKAYTMKVNAIKEAMGTYKGIIRKGLNPFADKQKDGVKK